MIRHVVVVLAAAACGSPPKPAPVLAARAPHTAPPVEAAPVESEEDPYNPHQGALCFGGRGPTDIRAFDQVAIRMFENAETVAEIGTCRIVENPGSSGYREITIMAGTTPIALLNMCGAKVLVPGINIGGGSLQIGDSTKKLESWPNLECSSDVGGHWCYGATEYDPIDRYFIAVPAQTTANGTVVQGPAAVALIAGKTIARTSYTTRCD